MHTIKPIRFEISFDKKYQLLTEKIIFWSTVILNEWMENHASSNELKKISSILIKIKLNKSKQFWGSLSDLTDIRSKKIKNFCLYIDKKAKNLPTLPLYFILAHELAHAIDFIKRDESWHDDYWKDICKHIGAQPDTHIEHKSMFLVKQQFPNEFNLAKRIIKKYKH